MPAEGKQVQHEAVKKNQVHLIVISFIAVICLGLPYWWWSTTTQRLGLPEERVQAWTSRLDQLDQLVSGETTDNVWPGPEKLYDVALKYAGRYHLVFSLFYQNASQEDQLLPTHLTPLLGQHIVPLLQTLDGLHTFHIQTQTQFFAPLTIPILSPNTNTNTNTSSGSLIRQTDLKAFVNSAEWNLASTEPQGTTTVHLIMYLAAKPLLPMQIADTSDNAFIIPQWGGVVLLADPSLEEQTKAMRIFASQLATLLGLSSSSSIKDLLHVRIVETARDAIETLAAIVTLAREQTNMPIKSQVRDGVLQSLDLLDKMQDAQTLTDMLNCSRRAAETASEAFFHPSMLGLLYFPDEHKYAVYMPLFGPIAVPLLAVMYRTFAQRQTHTHVKVD